MVEEWQEGEFDKGEVDLAPEVLGFLCWRRLKDPSVWNQIFKEAGITTQKGKHIANRILTNLIPLPERLTYLRHARYYTKGSLFDYEKVGYTALITVIDKLYETGFIVSYIGGLNLKTQKITLSNISPTLKLVEAFKDIVENSGTTEIEIDSKPTVTVFLKEGTQYDERRKKKPKKYLPVNLEAKHTKTVDRFNKKFNDEMDKHELSFDAPDEIQALYHYKFGKHPELHKKYIYSVYSKNLSNGGRNYGGVWIGMPKICRCFLKMDGESLVDIDLSACHIALLYEMIGKREEMPSNPYMYPKGDPRRDVAKQLQLSMVNITPKSKGRSRNQFRNDAVRSLPFFQDIQSEFERIKKTYTDKELAQKKKGEYWNSIKDEHQSKMKQYKEIAIELEELHSPIKDYFYTGIGTKLQFKESHIMRKIMKEALKLGIVILICHDGALVKESEADKVIELFIKTGYRYEIERLEDTKKLIKCRYGINHLLIKIKNKEYRIDLDIYKRLYHNRYITFNNNNIFNNELYLEYIYYYHKGRKVIDIEACKTFYTSSIEGLKLSNKLQKGKIKVDKNPLTDPCKSQPGSSIPPKSDPPPEDYRGYWDSKHINEIVYLDESEFYEDDGPIVVKYANLVGELWLGRICDPQINPSQIISRATQKEIEQENFKKPLEMTEYVSNEEPARYDKWGYSKAKGIIIKEWPGKVKA
ncbi:hypothetical protein [Desulfobacula sp.]|uniref:hypothetical protein n=1 Tax=Desulfobacula sp. TaxID=2593537 RepID=UPI00261919AB|nr:hypothetical protein [Desulfobacula sp.]